MRHAEEITDRIFVAGWFGQSTAHLPVGIARAPMSNLRPIWRSSNDVLNRLKPGIVGVLEKQDTTSAVLPEKIVADEEEHIDYLKRSWSCGQAREELTRRSVSRPPT